MQVDVLSPHRVNHKDAATQAHSHPHPGSSFMADIKIDYSPPNSEGCMQKSWP